jgi:RIO kinase 1
MQEDEGQEPSELKKYLADEAERRVFAKVFSRSAIMAVHELATKGYFGVLEFVVSTGKEAHVFRARDVSGNYKAVKIYKIETSDFKNMNRYLEGDVRFKEI